MLCGDNFTQDQLKKLIHYEPGSGNFTWLAGNRKGKLAGCLRGNGYMQINVGGKGRLSHRLAWFYVHGEWPRDQIDHINHDRADNRIVNLREADMKTNHRNMPISYVSKSGFWGVTWLPLRKRWQSRIIVDGKYHYLGSFNDKQEAIEARKAAERKYGFHMNHGG